MLLQTIFYVALTAEAMTAALAAGRRSMDWFGVCVLACVTALGGGTVRDIVLGNYPLIWVENPYLLVLCCVAAFITIFLARHVSAMRWPFLMLDAIGLVTFTIIGCNVALEMGQQPIIVVVAGLITGVAGGVLRDVLCARVPLVFSSELYATVAIVSGVLYYFGHISPLPHDLVLIGVIGVGFALRVFAIVFKQEIPKFVYDEDPR